MKLDDRTEKVVEMYSKYPFPFTGNHDNFFERTVYPSIDRLRKEYPIRRLLDAGCGTGNITAEIASLMPEVEVVAIDITEESLALARRRSQDRGFKNVTFRKSNLMEYDPELGLFDFVYSQGVIHHLSDPLSGMKNLNRYLKTGHHSLVWLYSLLGRRRILEMREALKILGVDNLPWEKKVALAKEARALFQGRRRTFLGKVIKVLSYIDRNGLKGLRHWLGYHSKMSAGGMDADIILADQILHPQDKFYRFTEAVDMFEQAGFEFVTVLDGMSNTVAQSFGPETMLNSRPFSPRDAYTLIELHEQPEGTGYLIQKQREVPV